MVDVWEADPELRLFKRLRERDPSDHQPVLDILGLESDNEELDEFWADPEVAHHILTSASAFVRAIHAWWSKSILNRGDVDTYTYTQQTFPCFARLGSGTWRTRPGRTSPPRT
jgi:hypothetical protein